MQLARELRRGEYIGKLVTVVCLGSIRFTGLCMVAMMLQTKATVYKWLP